MRAGIAAVEGVGDRVQEELLLGVLAHDRQAVRPGVLQVPGLLLLVVAGHEEDRRRSADDIEVGQRVLVLLLGGGGVAQRRRSCCRCPWRRCRPGRRGSRGRRRRSRSACSSSWTRCPSWMSMCESVVTSNVKVLPAARWVQKECSVARDPGGPAVAGVLHPVVVLGVRREAVDDHRVRLTGSGRGGRLLPCTPPESCRTRSRARCWRRARP